MTSNANRIVVTTSWTTHFLSGRMRLSRRGESWKRRATSQLRLEPLEGRIVPSTTYRIIDLGRLGGTHAAALSLNDHGEVVGQTDTKGHFSYAFRDSHGKMTSLGSLLGGNSAATGINNQGQIVGVSINADGSRSTVFLYCHGRMKAIGKVPGLLPTHMGPIFSINDRAQIIGFSSKSGNAQVLSGGRLKNLGSLKGLGSVALGINDHGAIVGYSDVTPYHDYFHPGTEHAFLYKHGHMSDLGTLGGSFAEATAINNRGDVVGWSSTAGDNAQDAFLYRNGTMIDLGRLGGAAAGATAVNDKGQVVGWSDVNGSTRWDQFLYSNGEMVDLSTLVRANTGFTLGNVVGINNRGQIAATGTKPDGKSVALLLNPVTNGA
jgi:probable HAF family extracellular repeat protein